jgi:tetraacyldisaccharide 4'-kinase
MSIRLFIFSIMKDERKDAAASVIKPFLLFLSFFYFIGIKIIDLCYNTGVRRILKAPLPVISVGNITVGGTGKTPFSIYLADYFVARGYKPAILTRGYGGDENIMIKDALPEVPVIVGQDRFRSSVRAKDFGLNIAVLDDGFQHRRLGRQLDILLVDTVSFPGNGRLIPAGVFREPISSVKRADIFVLTKTDAAGKEQRDKVKKVLEDQSPGTPFVTVRHKPVFLTDITGSAYSLEDMKSRKILILSAIADPGYLKFVVEKEGGMVACEKIYPDHYHYSQKDISEIHDAAQYRDIDMVITTKKDQVKLRELDLSSVGSKLFVLNITVEIEEGKENLIAGLDSFIHT